MLSYLKMGTSNYPSNSFRQQNLKPGLKFGGSPEEAPTYPSTYDGGPYQSPHRTVPTMPMPQSSPTQAIPTQDYLYGYHGMQQVPPPSQQPPTGTPSNASQGSHHSFTSNVTVDQGYVPPNDPYAHLRAPAAPAPPNPTLAAYQNYRGWPGPASNQAHEQSRAERYEDDRANHRKFEKTPTPPSDAEVGYIQHMKALRQQAASKADYEVAVQGFKEQMAQYFTTERISALEKMALHLAKR